MTDSEGSLGTPEEAIGIAWICFLSLHGNYAVHVLPSLLLMPLGYGTSFAPMYTAATSGVTACWMRSGAKEQDGWSKRDGSSSDVAAEPAQVRCLTTLNTRVIQRSPRLRFLHRYAVRNSSVVHLYDPNAVVSQAVRLLAHRADQILESPRATMGPPWAKDHRVALAATIVARLVPLDSAQSSLRSP
jgi:hypothetical protein